MRLNSSIITVTDTKHCLIKPNASCLYACEHACLVNIQCSVVITLADHLLASWPKQYCMLVLCCIAAFNITQWWISIHYPRVTKVFQSH